jgi:hypothetical protein
MALDFLHWKKKLMDLRENFDTQGFASFVDFLETGGHFKENRDGKAFFISRYDGRPGYSESGTHKRENDLEGGDAHPGFLPVLSGNFRYSEASGPSGGGKGESLSKSQGCDHSPVDLVQDRLNDSEVASGKFLRVFLLVKLTTSVLLDNKAVSRDYTSRGSWFKFYIASLRVIWVTSRKKF